MTTKKTSRPTRGGARPGSGRPRIASADVPTTNISVIVTVPQKEKLEKLGGAQWIRDRIDRAKTPE